MVPIQSGSLPFQGGRFQFGGGPIHFRLSSVYIMPATVNCLMLLMQSICCARNFALDNAGSNIAAKMAIIAITTSNSISVNAAGCDSPPGRISVNLVFANVFFTVSKLLYF